MSRWVGYYCSQCDQATETISNGEESLIKVVQLWTCVKKITSSGWLDVDLVGDNSARSELFNFLREHEGHPIKLRIDGVVTPIDNSE